MARDDFKDGIKKKLAVRVNYLCSNPDCNSLTIGPMKSKDGSQSIGIAAHICAASPQGPRYDPKMSPAERASIHNGIWLCTKCATTIDRDEAHYTVAMLHQWKETTEALVRQQQGRKRISDKDVTHAIATALSGYPKKLIPNALRHVHEAASETLEALDGRFQVLSSYINNKEVYELRAKEAASVRMSVKGDDASTFYLKYQSLLETGSELEIPSNNVYFEGSKLFEEFLSGQTGVFRISPNKREAVVKLHATLPISSESITFDEIRGYVNVGSKQFSFTGEACKGIIKLSITHEFGRESRASTCNISIDLDSWQGIDVLKAPYFANVFEFVESIILGAQLTITLEVEGNRVTAGKTTLDGGKDIMGQTFCLLKYTKAARAISAKFNTSFEFDYKSSFSEDDYLLVLNAERIINNQPLLTEAEISSGIEMDFKVDENVEAIMRGFYTGDLGPAVRIEEPSTSMCIFNKEVILPSKTTLLYPVLIKPLFEPNEIKPNSTVSVQLIPQEGFKMTTLFNYPK